MEHFKCSRCKGKGFIIDDILMGTTKPCPQCTEDLGKVESAGCYVAGDTLVGCHPSQVSYWKVGELVEVIIDGTIGYMDNRTFIPGSHHGAKVGDSFIIRSISIDRNDVCIIQTDTYAFFWFEVKRIF